MLALAIVFAQTNDFQSYRAHIEAANAAFLAGDARRMSAWLDAAPAKFRGWEWDYLKAQSNASVASIRVSDKSISKVQVSPDGTLVATAGSDGLIHLFDSKSLAKVAVLKGHRNSVYGLNFSADGSKLTSTSRDNTIRLWDVASRKEIGVLGEHPVTPYSAAFTPDGSRIVSVGWRMHPEKKSPVGLIRVWDVATRQLLNDQDYTTHPLSSLDFSKDGKNCYIGCWEYQTASFDMESYKVVKELTPKTSSEYKAVDWVEVSPDGGTLVTACKDKTTKFWNLATGEEVASLPHRGQVTSSRFSNNGKWLVTTAQDGAVRVFDANARKLVATLLGHGIGITCAAITPDGSRVFSGDVEGNLFVWDMRTPTAYEPTYEVAGAWSCVFSPDGSRIAAGTNLRTLQIRDAQSLNLLAESPTFGSIVVEAAWSPDGSRVAAGANNGLVRAFELGGMRQIWEFRGKGQMRATVWSKDGKWVAAGDGDTGIAYVLDAMTGRVVHQTKVAAGTLNLSFSPDSKILAIASGKELHFFEIGHGMIKRLVSDLASDALDVAYAPSGESVAVGETSGQVELFRVSDGKKLWTARTNGSQWGVDFSPDGNRIASTGYDFSTHLWDPKSGLEVFAIRDLPTQGFDVRFSPDGSRLAHMGGSGTTWILDRKPFRNRN